VTFDVYRTLKVMSVHLGRDRGLYALLW
jgi:hypothetical protein